MSLLLDVAMFVGGLIARVVFAGLARLAKGSLADMVRRYPGSCVLRSELVTWPGIGREVAATIRFVTGETSRLSFRDADGTAVLRIPAEGTHLELVEDGDTSYLRVRHGDATPLDFWVGGMSQEDALVALNAVLRPTPRLGA